MRRLLSLVLVLASVLAGCGGDDDEDVSSSVAEAEAKQYAEEVNTICHGVTNEVNRYFTEQPIPVVKSQVKGFFAGIAPVVIEAMDALIAVPQPDKGKENVEKLRRAAGLLGGRWEDATKKDAEAEKVFEEEGGFEGLRAAAKEHGDMPACETIGEEPQDEETTGRKADVTTFSKGKQTYIKEVDAICKKADAEDDKVEQEVFGMGFPPSVEAWAKGLPQFAGLGQKRLVEMQQVKPPEEEKATVDALIVEQQEVINQLEEAGRVAVTGDEQTLIPALQQLFAMFEELDTKLRQFGFQVCGWEDVDE